MNIIEKLGITPGPWEKPKRLTIITSSESNLNVAGCAPEMLEALIEECDWLEDSDAGDDEYTIKIRAIIEKATGKTWSEIKELINA